MTDLAGSLCPTEVVASGITNNQEAALFDGDYVYGSSGTPSTQIAARVATMGYQPGSAPPVTITRYYKRAYRTESLAYVYWDTTDASGAYPGGGTLYPLLGMVLYTRQE